MEANAVVLQADAAKALAEWKALFADEVTKHAKALTQASEQPGIITLAHFRMAAQSAVKSLADAIQESSSQDGNQEAA